MIFIAIAMCFYNNRLCVQYKNLMSGSHYPVSYTVNAPLQGWYVYIPFHTAVSSVYRCAIIGL